jgi:hypothetical protein
MHEPGFCAPGTRVEVIEGLAPTAARSGVVLYVGSDANVLVGWDDESTSVMPKEALLPTAADSNPPSAATA